MNSKSRALAGLARSHGTKSELSTHRSDRAFGWRTLRGMTAPPASPVAAHKRDWDALSDDIRRWGRELGFQAIGI